MKLVGRIRSAMRGVAFWVTVALLVAISMLLALPVCWRARWARRILRGGYRLMSPILLRITGVTIRQRGSAPALPAAGYILISNHSSNLDVLCLERAAGYPGLSVVMKSEVARMPVVGWYLRGLGWIGVERGQRGAAERLIGRIGREAPAGDRPQLLIFPEGTRTRDGALQRFRLGPFLMALHLQLPIVPVIIRGARMCHPRGVLGFRAGTVTLEFGDPLLPPPVPGSGGDRGWSEDRAIIVDKQHARLAQALRDRAVALYQSIDLDRAS